METVMGLGAFTIARGYFLDSFEECWIFSLDTIAMIHSGSCFHEQQLFFLTQILKEPCDPMMMSWTDMTILYYSTGNLPSISSWS